MTPSMYWGYHRSCEPPYPSGIYHAWLTPTGVTMQTHNLQHQPVRCHPRGDEDGGDISHAAVHGPDARWDERGSGRDEGDKAPLAAGPILRKRGRLHTCMAEHGDARSTFNND